MKTVRCFVELRWARRCRFRLSWSSNDIDRGTRRRSLCRRSPIRYRVVRRVGFVCCNAIVAGTGCAWRRSLVVRVFLLNFFVFLTDIEIVCLFVQAYCTVSSEWRSEGRDGRTSIDARLRLAHPSSHRSCCSWSACPSRSTKCCGSVRGVVAVCLCSRVSKLSTRIPITLGGELRQSSFALAATPRRSRRC